MILAAPLQRPVPTANSCHICHAPRVPGGYEWQGSYGKLWGCGECFPPRLPKAKRGRSRGVIAWVFAAVLMWALVIKHGLEMWSGE